jgi:hypothetical protein
VFDHGVELSRCTSDLGVERVCVQVGQLCGWDIGHQAHGSEQGPVDDGPCPDCSVRRNPRPIVLVEVRWFLFTTPPQRGWWSGQQRGRWRFLGFIRRRLRRAPLSPPPVRPSTPWSAAVQEVVGPLDTGRCDTSAKLFEEPGSYLDQDD